MEGYSMNSLVGREGVEKAFESYLHGTKAVSYTHLARHIWNRWARW